MTETTRKVKVAVLTGGISSEREISLQTGQCVAQALRSGGHETILADVTPDILSILDDETIDVFFICLHGQFGEDGQLQQILEEKSLCYTHSDSAASRLAIDKLAAKRRFACAGVNTPQATVFTERITKEQIQKRFNNSVDRFVVKPITHGSSVGVRIAAGAEEALKAAQKCREEFGDCMIEQFIPGREITVGILNGQALPILEIKPKVGFYDYHAKYLDDNTEYLFDTVNEPQLIEHISRDALKCFDCLGCRHVARVDFILAEDGTPYALEINTIPGMTEHSCVPKAAAKIGVSMSELCGRIVSKAIIDYQKTKSVPLMEVAAGVQKTKENQILAKDV
jgi:D-alanine-D-alanine ligase